MEAGRNAEFHDRHLICDTVPERLKSVRASRSQFLPVTFNNISSRTLCICAGWSFPRPMTSSGLPWLSRTDSRNHKHKLTIHGLVQIFLHDSYYISPSRCHLRCSIRRRDQSRSSKEVLSGRPGGAPSGARPFFWSIRPYHRVSRTTSNL